MIYEGKFTEVLLKLDGYEWYITYKPKGKCISHDCNSELEILVIVSSIEKKYALICRDHLYQAAWKEYEP